MTWCCGVLRGQARLCRTCESLSALAQLALMSINERNHVDQTCDFLYAFHSVGTMRLQQKFSFYLNKALTDLSCIFLI